MQWDEIIKFTLDGSGRRKKLSIHRIIKFPIIHTELYWLSFNCCWTAWAR